MLATCVFTLLLLQYDAAQSGETTGSGQPVVEDGGAAWQWPAASMPGVGPASDGPSWPPDLGATKDEARHGAAKDEA
jgi:hypothetical protein